MEINVLPLEDGKNYMIVDTIENGNFQYLLLANENDHDEIILRKVIHEDKDYLVKLDSDDEFDEVMTVFNEKYRKGGNDEK